MRELNDRTILTLFLLSIVVSLGGAYITIQSVNKLAGTTFSPVTGFATSVPNATVNLSVDLVSSIKFVAAQVDFGTGSVNTSGGFNNCTLNTYGTRTGCADFNTVGTSTTSGGFTIENDGNTNLSVELVSNASAAAFIGVGSAVFGWNASVNETGSCKNISTSSAPENNVNPNTTIVCGGAGSASADCGTIFESVTTGGTGKNICPRLLFTDSNDALRIDLNITIPYDAPAGKKAARLIVTGTRHPTS